MTDQKVNNQITRIEKTYVNNELVYPIWIKNERFQPIGLIKEGVINDNGKDIPAFELCDMKGRRLKFDIDYEYIEQTAVVNYRDHLEKVASHRRKEKTFEKAAWTKSQDKGIDLQP